MQLTMSFSQVTLSPERRRMIEEALEPMTPLIGGGDSIHLHVKPECRELLSGVIHARVRGADLVAHAEAGELESLVHLLVSDLRRLLRQAHGNNVRRQHRGRRIAV